jgi:hypothetical protein
MPAKNLKIAALLSASLFFTWHSSGQALAISAGGSTILPADGASLTLYQTNRETSGSLGYSAGHLIAGARYMTVWRGWNTALGDYQEFVTVGATGLAAVTRGVTATRKAKWGTVTLWAGMTGSFVSTPYLFAGAPGSFGAGAVYTRKFARFDFAAIAAISQGKTALAAVGYHHSAVRLSGTAGMLNNAVYSDGQASVTFRHVGFTADHTVYTFDGANTAITSVSASGNVGIITASANQFVSRVGNGMAFGGSLRLGDVTIQANEFDARERSSLVSATARLSRRLTVSGYATRAGSTALSAGFNYTSNLANISVAEQEFFIGTTGRFEHALTVSIGLQVHNANATLQTSMLPTGAVHWTASGTEYNQVGVESQQAGGSAIGRYVISGVIVDQDGAPISGIAVKIGKQIVFSDDSGAFSARVKRSVASPVSIDLADSVAAGNWRVIDAPQSVKADASVKIVLLRI